MIPSRLLRLYHRMPGPIRSAAATMHGLYLRYWRHGTAMTERMAAVREREDWSAARWAGWQDERLARLLHRAATRVPYYRAHWAARRRRGDRAAWDALEHWPVLDKAEVRENPRAFVADDRRPARMYHERTSGTTGAPLDLWRSRAGLQQLFAIAQVRTRSWHGVSEGARWARIGGKLVAPVDRRRPPFWVWNAAMGQLYLSAYHLAPDLLRHYVDALLRYRITYLAGYPSALAVLAGELLRRPCDDLRLRVVVTNAEPLTADQRARIAVAFGCPVRETYGMAENVAAASECQHGGLHLWPEVGRMEVLDGGAPVPRGVTGDVVATGLLHQDMPLIRYRVGDRAARPAADGPCGCGRTLPLLDRIDGRISDVVRTPDGRRLARFGPVFHGLPVRESQLVQDTLGGVRVVLATEPGFSPASADVIADRLRERLGAMDITFQYVDAVPRTPNGKIRGIVSHVPEGAAAAAASAS